MSGQYFTDLCEYKYNIWYATILLQKIFCKLYTPVLISSWLGSSKFTTIEFQQWWFLNIVTELWSREIVRVFTVFQAFEHHQVIGAIQSGRGPLLGLFLSPWAPGEDTPRGLYHIPFCVHIPGHSTRVCLQVSENNGEFSCTLVSLIQ